MSFEHYHSVCRRNRGRAVEIRTLDGRIHRGIISDVDDRNVYLQPLRRNPNLWGFGYGYGYGFGRPGFGAGIAIGAIATLVLLPFFW
ncbi:LSm family protein [Oceanobacillus damuensis]|uniref:hypothetical protein n=1 Tax=Oceanobacillus damuensis TaxID=937928 RepID=UPI00082D2F0B|nr:hypothetical protein [Oceanobacillus damuensis]